jgi:type I restriction enzyme S subunit
MAAYPTAPLRDVCAHVEYGYTASSTPDSSVGPRFLRITDIVPERLDWESVPFSSSLDGRRTIYRLRR